MRLTVNQNVVGSIPTSGAKECLGDVNGSMSVSKTDRGSSNLSRDANRSGL
jgi:hypothetical protein